MKHRTPKTPYLATDGIIEVYNQSGNFEGIVLIERKNTPTGLAFPGGFVEVGESVEDALKREMKEDTALECTPIPKETRDFIRFQLYFSAGQREFQEGAMTPKKPMFMRLIKSPKTRSCLTIKRFLKIT